MISWGRLHDGRSKGTMRTPDLKAMPGVKALVRPPRVHAQRGERVRRVIFQHGLAESDPEAQSRVAAFGQALAALGWVENRNVRVEHRFSAGDPARIEEHTAELVG